MGKQEARGLSRRRFLQGTAAASLGTAATAVGITPAAAEPIAEVSIEPHGAELRGLELVLESPTSEGRFGYMFKNQPPQAASEDLLSALGKTMEERPVIGTDLTDPETGEPVLKSDGSPVVATKDDNDAFGENPSPVLTSGFTFVGQFIDHDITFDTTTLSEQQSDPNATTNFRTPRYDLDAIYGRGPKRILSSTTPTTGTSSGSSSAHTARLGVSRRPPTWSTTCRATPTARRSWRIPVTTRR